ncbi:hypothetical protein GE061_014417 [Apolygus lucorum]|uniref:BET1 homolog n=1 Tax=Apolygus lucorum TaxID=248454 RepID=A0A6A4KC38_APOLU|nr:hypothetical protein GE061_014417 [Apolygus lucorum]
MNIGKMRRSAGNYSYHQVPAGELEEENNEMTEHLKEKIGVLKSLSIDIGAEVKYQDKLIREMDEDFERTGGFMGNTISRVIRLTKASHNYYIFYLFVFSIVIFFILYISLKFR